MLATYASDVRCSVAGRRKEILVSLVREGRGAPISVRVPAGRCWWPCGARREISSGRSLHVILFRAPGMFYGRKE